MFTLLIDMSDAGVSVIISLTIKEGLVVVDIESVNIANYKLSYIILLLFPYL